MTIEETAKIMAMIKSYYPNYQKDITVDEAKQTVKSWHLILKEYDSKLVFNAVITVVTKSKFPPCVADIIEKIQLITEPEEMTEIEAWRLVRKAVCNSTYNSESEFTKLPERIQRTLGGAETLRAWAMSEVDDLDTVISSNFQRSYRARTANDKEYQSLPQSVKNYMLNVADKLPKLES